MSIDSEIQQAIKQAMSNLSIEIRFDETDDLEVSIHYDGEQLYSDYISLDNRYVKRG